MHGEGSLPNVCLVTLLNSEQYSFTIGKIPPATCPNGKQNIQFQNKINWQ